MNKRILDFTFRITVKGIAALLHIYIYVFQIKKVRPSHKNKRVAAFPYSPEGWPGGHERIANWKPYFESEGIDFDVFWATDDKSFLTYQNSKNLFILYKFYWKILLTRIKMIFKLNDYDVIWIQRAYVPFYPYQDAYFEKILSKIHPNVIMDYYDADYEANYDLTINSVKYAHKVTVSTDFLKIKYLTFNPSVFKINMTINKSLYLQKTKNNSDIVKIGWMGNIGNIEYLHQLRLVFKKLENKYPFLKFHFVCRKKVDFELNNVDYSAWGEDDFDYYDWLSSIDIGVTPYLDDSDVQKAKSPMKTLEFLACNIPVVSSTYGAFVGMENEINYLLANTEEEWFKQISFLIENKEERKKIGKAGYNYLITNHTYDVNYAELKAVFFEKE